MAETIEPVVCDPFQVNPICIINYNEISDIVNIGNMIFLIFIGLT